MKVLRKRKRTGVGFTHTASQEPKWMCGTVLHHVNMGSEVSEDQR
jgi:hypothetical protein